MNDDEPMHARARRLARARGSVVSRFDFLPFSLSQKQPYALTTARRKDFEGAVQAPVVLVVAVTTQSLY